MIVDWDRFVAQEKPVWERLEAVLARLAADPYRVLSLEEVRDLELLYQRTAADLARLSAMATEPATRQYLENLVSRAYVEIHGGQGERRRWRPWEWFSVTLPNTFRRQFGAFRFAFILMLVGCGFGAFAVSFDAEAKEIIMPFGHGQRTPSERVAQEESARKDRLSGHKATFSGQLMTHNTRVTLTSAALGLSWGVGTLLIMFYNGVILGAIALDYIVDGQLVFLLGWLLPHGVIEIPAMLVGGQAGFVLASALLGRRQNKVLSARLRAVVPDVATLCGGAALMLVWAGIVESFLSQYHEPVLPYWLKIAFGVVELCVLVWFLSRAGRGLADSSAKAGLAVTDKERRS